MRDRRAYAPLLPTPDLTLAQGLRELADEGAHGGAAFEVEPVPRALERRVSTALAGLAALAAVTAMVWSLAV